MKSSRSAEEFILSNPSWQEALILFRSIFISAGLEETIKWGVPVYTWEGSNVAGMACFKSYIGIWFYQGALLEDKEHKLLTAQEGVTKALRQWRFSTVGEVLKEENKIREYTLESIRNMKDGAVIKAVKNLPLNLPEELAETLLAESCLKACFDVLSLTRKREFAEYIRSAKRAETKAARLGKIIPMIQRGEGLNDKYK
jgi:uncharacterized protein YdeI (YjbR/CyaY-like superfamily)